MFSPFILCPKSTDNIDYEGGELLSLLWTQFHTYFKETGIQEKEATIMKTLRECVSVSYSHKSYLLMKKSSLFSYGKQK